MIVPDTARALAYYDHPFFEKYPAITRNEFGKGVLTYEGTVLSEKLQKAVLLGVLNEAGLVNSDQDLPVAERPDLGRCHIANRLAPRLTARAFGCPVPGRASSLAGTDLSVAQASDPWHITHPE